MYIILQEAAEQFGQVFFQSFVSVLPFLMAFS